MLTIDSFHGEYRWLSNFWPAVIRGRDGILYPSVEHYYQAQKTEGMADRYRIAECQTPGKAKQMGRAVVVREDWDQCKVDVMRYGLNEKFRDPDLRQKLLNTGDALLVEGNTWGDTFWGICNGAGQNHLGYILMEIRRSLEPVEEETSDEPETETAGCPVCGGEGGILGALGWTQHFCCRDCGMQFSKVKVRNGKL